MSNIQERSHPPLECIVEVCTDGERRAFAQGRMLEVQPDLFELTPFSLRELCGPAIVWSIPPQGAPLPSLIRFQDGHDALMWWAMKTVATCASARR